MTELEKQFDSFNLTAKLAEHLTALSTPGFNHVEGAKRIVVETVVIEGGDRRVINAEVTYAQLV
jgi:hypothetical protein